MTDKRRNVLILLLVGALLAASAVVITTQRTVLGLDLRGGVELVYEAQPTKQATVTPESIDRSIDIMRERVDTLGVAEPEIAAIGNQQIQVSLPDVTDAERAIRLVGSTAQLYFYDWEQNVVGPDGRPDPTNFDVTGGPNAGDGQNALSHFDAVIRASRRPAQNQRTATTGTQYYLVDRARERVLRGPEQQRDDLTSDDPAPRGSSVVEVQEGTKLVRAETPPNGSPPDRWFVLNDDPGLLGTEIENPEQNFDQGAGGTGQPIVTFDFTDEGRRKWQQVTREIAQRGQSFVPSTGEIVSDELKRQHFAIVLDDQLVSVPFIDFTENPDGIDGANGSQIQGGFTIDTAQELANQLKSGALPLRLELISQNQVSATLGAEALDEGLLASAAGFLLTALFLLTFYRLLGMIAVVGLAAYGVFFFALIKLIPITMTLPGIAGLVLTLGVAADANIVVFERIKEEIRSGKSIAGGIASGYRKGLSAIIDANVVTFMVAFILFILATAGVKGFAFTLGIGTLISLFTAVLATSAVLGVLAGSRQLERPSLLGAGKQRVSFRFDYFGLSKWFFSASGAILLVCALAVGSQGLNFGIDFESGTRIEASFERSVTEDQVREAVTRAGVESAEVQRVEGGDVRPNSFNVATAELRPAQVAQVTEALDEAFGIRGSPDTQSIGPTFGQTIARSAIVAIIASLLVISAYIALRFEWKFAVPVLIALCHDLLITAGVYALLDREVTASTVAALLTIMGYSLYDTIIVFDRVRENVPRMPRATFSQIVNRSASEVMGRSLATSISTLFPVTALLLFGGQTLRDFAFALFVGIVSGTYSSIFIAIPILSHQKEREPVWRRRRRRILEEDGSVPGYADEAQDVVPSARRARQRVTAPDGPGGPQVSREEFEEMVRDIQDDVPQAKRPGRPNPGAKDAGSARGGAVAASAVEEPPAPEPSSGADLSPEDVVMPDEKPRRITPPNRRRKRHGR